MKGDAAQRPRLPRRPTHARKDAGRAHRCRPGSGLLVLKPCQRVVRGLPPGSRRSAIASGVKPKCRRASSQLPRRRRCGESLGRNSSSQPPAPSHVRRVPERLVSPVLRARPRPAAPAPHALPGAAPACATTGICHSEVEIYVESLNDGESTARGAVAEALIDDATVASSQPVDVVARAGERVPLLIPRQYVEDLFGERPHYRGETPIGSCSAMPASPSS